MRVHGESMRPALQPHDLLLIGTRSLAGGHVQRGALVVAQPLALEGRMVVKRLAGVPHETLEIEGQHWSLAEDQWLLLSDEPSLGVDSRRFGPISSEELIGSVCCRVWPLRHSR